MLRKKIERLEKKLSAKKRILVVIEPNDEQEVGAKSLDDVKQKVAEKYGFNSFEELEKSYDVITLVFHIVEVDRDPETGEIMELEDEYEGLVYGAWIV